MCTQHVFIEHRITHTRGGNNSTAGAGAGARLTHAGAALARHARRAAQAPRHGQSQRQPGGSGPGRRGTGTAGALPSTSSEGEFLFLNLKFRPPLVSLTRCALKPPHLLLQGVGCYNNGRAIVW